LSLCATGCLGNLLRAKLRCFKADISIMQLMVKRSFVAPSTDSKQWNGKYVKLNLGCGPIESVHICAVFRENT